MSAQRRSLRVTRSEETNITNNKSNHYILLRYKLSVSWSTFTQHTHTHACTHERMHIHFTDLHFSTNCTIPSVCMCVCKTSAWPTSHHMIHLFKMISYMASCLWKGKGGWAGIKIPGQVVRGVCGVCVCTHTVCLCSVPLVYCVTGLASTNRVCSTDYYYTSLMITTHTT